jgi:2-polyprenyl-3-methyl-5-hydroxy-6-metoxy-1,4-benzoquinol methylase
MSGSDLSVSMSSRTPEYRSVDLDVVVTRESVDAIVDALPPFPTEAVEGGFRSRGVVCNEDIPRDFAKYFAVMAALVGGSLPGKRVIDVGAGLGVFVAQSRRLGMKATGTDIFTDYEGTCQTGAVCIMEAYGESAEDARRAFIHHDICGSNLSEGDVDFVTSFGMLEHICGKEPRRRAVRHMMAAVAPGGTLLISCGPNRYFPIDFFHYGPTFVFYHCLPRRGRQAYLRLFGRFTAPGQSLDPDFLEGMRVAEIRKHILEAEPNAKVRQLFPLWVRVAQSRYLKPRPIRLLATAVARMLAALRAEPVIILAATKPGSSR